MATGKGGVTLVTGSTDGIGQHTAIRLAREGWHVLVHGRSKERVKASVERVEGASGGGGVVGICADISTFEGMRDFCRKVEEALPGLVDEGNDGGGDGGIDVLINNAGVFEPRERRTADGLELTFAVNIAAPFVITKLLLPQLRRAAARGGRPAHVVNASSISQSYDIDFENLQFEKGRYSAHEAYSTSKLAVAMFSAELAARLDAAEVVCNALDPGTVGTKMLEAGWGMGGIPVSCANDEFWLATAGREGVGTGRYYVSRRDSRPSPPVMDQAVRRRLWEYLERVTGVKY